MIELKSVCKTYGARTLFKNVTASFAGGSVHLVTGRNGSGKSTLLRMIGGLSRVDSGEIAFADEDAVVGYLGHRTFLYPNLTAHENLVFWQRAYGRGADSQSVDRMLVHVGLAAHAHTRAGVFSRGMSQRLSLARVLLLAPPVLLLDEPETGLDTASRRLLLDEIDRARARGACVLWVSHLADGDGLADRVFEVRDRKLLEVETAREGTC